MKFILDVDNEKARTYFLKNEFYCNLNLPSYFYFETLLQNLSNILIKNSLDSDQGYKDIDGYNDINHIIYINKDGKLSWRPISLLHPVLYVDLVHLITEKDNWNAIKKRFKEFQLNDKIECKSIPIVPNCHKKQVGQQIQYWWKNIEQESIALYLDYSYMFTTDIANCYSSIYTHSIDWAIETREFAKKNRSGRSLGGKLDKRIQKLQGGQTNGIPQGSILMDFIAEIVLGYIDSLLAIELENLKINNYKILRYRDDYRIFVNNELEGEVILKKLSELIISFGLKLNSSKTKNTSEIIIDSIKEEKIYQWKNPLIGDDLFKSLVLIKDYSLHYSNSGGLVTLLSSFLKKIESSNSQTFKDYGLEVLVSITTDIMASNPKSVIQCAAIISQLFRLSDTPDVNRILSKKIYKKITGLSYSNYAEIWLQRICTYHEESYNEKLCVIVSEAIGSSKKGGISKLWNIDWIRNQKLKRVLLEGSILDIKQVNEMKSHISVDEIDIFGYERYFY